LPIRIFLQINLLKMIKTGGTYIGLLFGFAFMMAVAIPASAATTWDATGNYDVDFTCVIGCSGTYAHDMDLIQNSSDTVSGNGGYLANNPHTFEWLINSGSVSGSNLHLETSYTLGASCDMTIDGTINSSGTMIGTWSDNCDGARSGTWITTSGNAHLKPVSNIPTNKDACKKGGYVALTDNSGSPFKNQGQCVSYYNYLHNGTVSTTLTFSANDSTYYNCSIVCSNIYATGPVSFTWDSTTGVVTSGYYNETIGSTTYMNVVDYGSVSGGNVNLTFSRTVPNSYGPFNFVGTLSGNVLSGLLDGPYLLTATGVITP
jgi:hypothetical protein